MRFTFTDEQGELRAVLRRFLEERAGLGWSRDQMGKHLDGTLWHALANELGLQGMAVPEDLGGQGWGMVELAIASEELGRVLHPGPFLASTVLATRLLVAAEDRSLLAPLLAGERTAAVALADDGGAWRVDAIDTILSTDGTVHGTKRRVLAATEADDLLVIARLAGSEGHDGVVLVAVDPADDGVHLTPLEGIDPTRGHADLVLDHAAARVIASDAAATVGRATDETAACLAAELVGVAQRCLERTVTHVRDREQFGVPVGSFQAVKHRLADLLVTVEHARSAAYVAACRATGPDDGALALAASMALLICGDAAAQAGREMVQLHGGIGFTWEHDAHLFVRRAQADRQLLGPPSWHTQRVWTLSGEKGRPAG